LSTSVDGIERKEDFFKNVGLGCYFSYSGSRFYTYTISLGYDWGPVYNREFTEAYDGKATDLWTSFELKPTPFLFLFFL
jgi:hypothetical protein